MYANPRGCSVKRMFFGATVVIVCGALVSIASAKTTTVSTGKLLTAAIPTAASSRNSARQYRSAAITYATRRGIVISVQRPLRSPYKVAY